MALTVTVPRTHTAIANMPIAHEEPVTPFLKQVSFARTPPMPASLFALIVGELEQLTLDSQGTSLSVLTIKGKAEQARFALAGAAKLLRYFDEYFGFKYPLSKLDLVALPGGMDDALESWGAVAFSETLLLFDRKTSPSSARRTVYRLLGPAMARQWLGSLVTSSSWEDIWLTEALAGTMGSKAAGSFFPRWPVGMDLHAVKEAAMRLDARRTSHPLQQSIPRGSEPMSGFDGMAVGKGGAVIRMLEGAIGADSFRTAIRSYIAQHAYGSATSADLWRVMGAASSHPIGDIARTFTEQPGVPLVKVQTRCVDNRQSILMQQARYSMHDPDASPQSWLVPVTIGLVQARDTEPFLLRGEKEILFGSCGEAIKLHFGDHGYYRVEYDAAANTALTKSFALMSAADRVNLLDDAWAMAEARADPSAYLSLVEKMGAGEDRGVWEQVIRTFARLDRIAQGRPERARLQAYMRAKLRPALDRLGWDSIAREDEESSMLRARIVRALGELNDPEVVAEARRRFAAFLQDARASGAELREAVIHVVGLHANRPTYESLLVLAGRSPDAAEQLRYYSAAASARDPTLARATLDLILTPDFPDWLKPRLLDTISSAGEQPQMVWEFLKTHFAALAMRLGPRLRESFVPNFMGNFSDTEHARELATFPPALASPTARAASERAYEAIAINAEIRERVLPSVHAWIEANIWQN
jgi:aminopeptidase N